jgi:hypothetical protein
VVELAEFVDRLASLVIERKKGIWLLLLRLSAKRLAINASQIVYAS